MQLSTYLWETHHFVQTSLSLSLFQKQLTVFKGGQHDVKIDVLSETHSLVALQGVYHTVCAHMLCSPSVCVFLWPPAAWGA